MTIEFDKNAHRYKINGRFAPSVTQVLPPVSEEALYNPIFISKRKIGTVTHSLCEVLDFNYKSKLPSNIKLKGLMELSKEYFHDNKILLADIDEMGKEAFEYVKGWIKFRNNVKPKILANELLVVSHKYKFAGTMDRLININGTKYICDIKTTTKISPIVSLQLAGYLIAYNEMNPASMVKDRMALQLMSSGEYKIYTFKKSKLNYETTVFISKVISYHWDMDNLNHHTKTY